MKPFRLVVHQKTFSDDDLVISQKDYPEAKKNDIVEIYHPSSILSIDDDNNKKNETEEDHPRLLLQIKSFKDDLNATRTISVEQSIAAAFGLKTYKDVIVKLVDPANVALDSLEITFKEQYMGRSEMWWIRQSLANTCVYMNKKLEFCGGIIRCQVYEMWIQGDRVACGIVTEATNIVFRSSTAMVYIFLQMSSEMWDFDIYGDLYFEKAVNGFLSDLFLKWKKNGSNHEITIVLFSRTFYEANTLEEFPECMRECLQKDYKGRYYEDFYRVAIQNERFDDCSNILVQLRRIFQDYLNTVLTYHCKSNLIIPSACNSTAAQGNFLEVLNMSLNVFEKHYLDRSFDRTGQLSVVVTPGVGVFEVDRELTNITKQRIIDGGVGSDLVCVGEQPLHAVPLLKFHNKDSHLNRPDNYSMPHWINLSFYSTNKKIPYSNFVPRIKLPPSKTTDEKKTVNQSQTIKTTLLSNQNECIRNSFFDYDAYDAAVFQYPSVQYLQEVSLLHTRFSKFKKSSSNLADSLELSKSVHRKLSDPDVLQIHRTDDTTRRSEPIAIPSTNSPQVLSPHNEDKEFSPPMRMVVGSEGSPTHESRALINPFDPSHVTIKLTSNRRRWTHIFPKGPTGILIQQHHYQAIPTQVDHAANNSNSNNNSGSHYLNQENNKLLVVTPALQEYCKKRPNYNLGSNSVTNIKNSAKSLTLLWGATGEQEWTPALTTGVDWKSLIIPACLPITTDYYPDQRTLDTDYVVSLYTLVPDSVYADFAQQRGPYKKPLTTSEVFLELILQRLTQGFQLVLRPNQNVSTVYRMLMDLENTNSTYTSESDIKNENQIHLSIGRLFHVLSMNRNIISVTRHKPRHPYPGFKYQYRYRFYAPYHDNYEESYATFTTEKLEQYNWNYLDHYVCTGGDTTEFELVDALKYWRFRIYLLPLNTVETKKIVDGAPRCDIYTLPNNNEHQQMIDGFLKFIETAVNKLKKSNNASKKTRMSLHIQNLPPLTQPRRNSMSNFGQNIGSSNSPFRERLGSNRLIDKPRPRSGSKVLDRNRLSQGSSQDQSIDLTDANSDDLSVGIVSLKMTSTSTEIIEAMKHPNYGLSFLNSQQNLPNYTFVTADAVNWLITHRDGVTTLDNAIQILQNLHKEKLVRHASGDSKKSFVYGFVLFYILPEKDDKDTFQPYGDLETFENDFIEVEIKPPLNWGMTDDDDNGGCAGIQIHGGETNTTNLKIPHFLQDHINPDYSDIDLESKLYKRMRLETDIMNKSGRNEWGHVKYQTIFRPDQAYELVIEWLTSSGSIIADLLSGWHRKAQSCNLQMIPIPHDPLALPYSKKSDPLRGPIFVPLDISCLESNSSLFKDFHEDSWLERMFLFQEAIIQNFGFIKCLVEPSNTNDNQTNVISREHQYIHATGTIFILISITVPKIQRSRTNSLREKRHHLSQKYSIHAQFAPSPHEAYITRHVSGKNKADYDNSKKMGFLWCWNHMVSKRWRTNQGVDSNFQVKCLKDFRAFCSNSENRLYNFWRDSIEAKDNAFTDST